MLHGTHGHSRTTRSSPIFFSRSTTQPSSLVVELPTLEMRGNISAKSSNGEQLALRNNFSLEKCSILSLRNIKNVSCVIIRHVCVTFRHCVIKIAQNPQSFLAVDFGPKLIPIPERSLSLNPCSVSLRFSLFGILTWICQNYRRSRDEGRRLSSSLSLSFSLPLSPFNSLSLSPTPPLFSQLMLHVHDAV